MNKPSPDTSSNSESIPSLSCTPPDLHSVHHKNGDSQSEPSLSKFWKVETLGIQAEELQNDDECAVQHFKQTVKYLPEERRYEVCWPWRGENSSLPNNYVLAYCRLQSVYKNISKQPGLLKEYHEILQDQLRRGIIEVVPESELHSQNIIHHLPHHPVIKMSRESTKIRIVMDASSHMGKNTPSLNSLMFKGPDLITPLVSVLLRFRLNPIAICSDLEKAYMMLKISPNDRDCCRLLWLKNYEKPPTPDNIQILRFQRVLFGVIASSFLLAMVIKHHLESSDSPFAEKLLQDFYVDNYLGGTSTLSEAKQLYQAGKYLFGQASMNMRQFASNSKEFMQWLPEEDRTKKETGFSVLGMLWNRTHDFLSVFYKRSDHPHTKRGILKTIAEIYEPLGTLSPCLLRGKLLIQDLWRQEVDWDQPISEEHDRKWIQIKQEMDGLGDIQIPRYIGGEKYKLLCFTDSSKDCYSACVYLHCQVSTHYQCNLIFCKSRVSPIGKKSLTIPRLELLSVLIGVRCLKFAETHLKVNVEKRMLFSDSKCCLHWIKSTRQLSRFIHSRTFTFLGLNRP